MKKNIFNNNRLFFLLRFILLLSVSATGSGLYAQLCTGSLGDPIVNIDFGSGTGRGPALGSSVTAYTYAASGDLGEGVYTIANTTSGLKGNAWHNTTDHTGNTNGYMMVVNCAVLANEGVFYTKTVTGLCSNTTHEFSAWLMNVMNPSFGADQYHPNVTFRVSTTGGTVLGSYTTGDLPQTFSPTWKQYGFYFTTTTETEVVITTLNSGQSAIPGNDIALDDIKFRPCGPSVTVSINGVGTSADICEGDNTVFTLTGTVAGGYTNPSYQWQVSTDGGTTWTDIAGATSTTYVRPTVSTSGTYMYRLAVAQGTNISSSSCRINSDPVTITVNRNPDPEASSNNPTCVGDTLRLSAAKGGATYTWTGPNGFTSSLQDPVINSLSAANNGKYFVTMVTSIGCTNKDSIEISVNPAPTADAGNDVTICEGNSTTLTGSGSSNGYVWSPSTGLSDATSQSPTASPTDTTTYVLTVSNGQCKAYDSVTVNIWKKPTANAGPDQAIVEGNAAQLSGTAGGTDVSYYWEPDYNITSTSILDPAVTPITDTTYTFYVVSNNGCGTASDNVFIRVYKKITIPNVFSPNNDGINDTWRIQKLETYPDAVLSVFNRYGQLVYRNTGYAKEWDGRYNGNPLPVGTYYYVIDLKSGIPNFSGWVMVLR